MLSSKLQDHRTASRRDRLKALDAILLDLETMNVREVESLPCALADRLRRAGVVYRDGAAASEIIDLVFRAQEAFLVQPATTAGRRSAA